MIPRQRHYLLKLQGAYVRLYLLKPKPREAELIKSQGKLECGTASPFLNACEI